MSGRILKWTAAVFGAALSVALVAVLAIAYLSYGDRRLPSVRTGVIIARGSTFAQIAAKLVRRGVISNVLTFRILARLRHEEDVVRAGEYRFAPHQSQSSVLRALVSGGAQVAKWVTIPEGFTDAQIAARLGREGIGSARTYAAAFARSSIVVDGVRTTSLEGFLFPSTYLIPIGASPREVAGRMTRQFLRELPRDAAARARALHVSVAQAVTVASLIEREAKSEVDRPKIASVIYNRLRIGMPLQIDASIEYALPHHASVLSYRDLQIDSPYNTYLHAGLPPTPIANPGLPSLEAALHPAKTADLYYVYCGHGRHVFATTLAQHQANVARCLP